MIRRTPCEYFLKYLIIHPDGLSDGKIQERLQELGLDNLGDYYITKQREKLRPPSPFYPFDQYHNRSQRFLIKEGVQALFLHDSDALTALKILEFPRHKEFVEAMIMAYAPFEAIADSLTRHKKFRCKAKAIELFKHYFWNIDLLDSVQMRALIDIRATSAAHHADERVKGQAEPLRKAHYNDPRRVISQLPYAPMSAVMAQMKMGLMPARVNLTKVVEKTREAAAMAAYEALSSGGIRDSQRARDFAEVVRAMTEVLDTIVRPEENLREDLAQIALRTEDSTVPYIHQLSAGEHTVDMHPVSKDPNHGSYEDTGEGPPGAGSDHPG